MTLAGVAPWRRNRGSFGEPRKTRWFAASPDRPNRSQRRQRRSRRLTGRCLRLDRGVVRSLDENSYTIRLAPRHPRHLERQEHRTLSRARWPKGTSSLPVNARSTIATLRARIKYSFGRSESASTSPQEARVPRANKKGVGVLPVAAALLPQPAIWWVVGPKKEETKVRRACHPHRRLRTGPPAERLRRP